MTMKPRPCCFCGSTDDPALEDGDGFYYVHCGRCGAQGPTFEPTRKFKDQWASDAAVRAWNGDRELLDAKIDGDLE